MSDQDRISPYNITPVLINGIPLSIKRRTVVTHVCNFDVFGSCLDIFSSHSFFSQPFNPHVWSRQNFSSQYQYNINQMSYENKEKY